MIGLFSVFEVMEPQRNYMEELYDWVSTNSHGCFIVTFLALHSHEMKNSLELPELFFCENVCRLTR
jgi:hypothetical protein